MHRITEKAEEPGSVSCGKDRGLDGMGGVTVSITDTDDISHWMPQVRVPMLPSKGYPSAATGSDLVIIILEQAGGAWVLCSHAGCRGAGEASRCHLQLLQREAGSTLAQGTPPS